MSIPESGAEYMGYPVRAKYGSVISKDGTKSKPVAVVFLQIRGGELNGWEFQLKFHKWTQESMKFDIPKLKALGWKGRDFSTFVSDHSARADVPIKFIAKLAEHNGQSWWTVDKVGIWEPPMVALDADQAAEANEWLADYNEGSSDSATRQRQIDPPSQREELPPVHDDDIPF